MIIIQTREAIMVDLVLSVPDIKTHIVSHTFNFEGLWLKRFALGHLSSLSTRLLVWTTRSWARWCPICLPFSSLVLLLVARRSGLYGWAWLLGAPTWWSRWLAAVHCTFYGLCLLLWLVLWDAHGWAWLLGAPTALPLPSALTRCSVGSSTFSRRRVPVNRTPSPVTFCRVYPHS